MSEPLPEDEHQEGKPSAEAVTPASLAQPAEQQPGSSPENGRRRRRHAPGRREERSDGLEREPPSAALVRDDGAPADIDPARLDLEGLKILNRLHRFEHQAYFVGGCVRDLLLSRQPKDFDIATSAHPGEVRSLFRNCRLIGRRFRLAHVFFRGGKVIEVSTFRANPVESEDGEEPAGDLLITQDNVFGTEEQDARRRDFTVNGLFYDIRLGRVIDHVGGRADLERRVLRTIGNPEVRLREDPVRILRAIRFAARLGLEIEPQTYAAMEGAVEDLPRCASARLLEEVLRLLRGGASQRSLELMDALGALKLLLPPIHDYLQRTGDPGRRALFERLRALDARIGASPLDDSLIMAALLWPLAREVHEKDGADLSAGQAVDTLLEQMVHTARLPRRIADRTRQLLWAQTVLLGERKRRRSLASFRRHPLYRDALQVLQIGVEATGEARETLERWTTGETHDGAQAPREGEQGRRRKRHRGGRGRKRRRTGGQADLPPAQSLG